MGRDTRALVVEAGKVMAGRYERYLTVAALVLAVLAAVNSTAAHAVESGLGWLGVAPLSVAALYAVARAHSNLSAVLRSQLQDVQDRAALSEARVMELNEAPRPVLSFRPPRIDPHVHMPLLKTHAVFIFGSVVNFQSQPGKGATAESAIPRISCTKQDGTPLISPFEGRWRSAQSVVTSSPFQTTLGAVDIPANGSPHEFDVAMILPTADQFMLIDSGQQARVVPEAGAVVTVEIHGSNFDPITASYYIWTEEKGMLHWSNA